jgi:hypothetical protein
MSERITKVRQAAAALFTTTRQVTKQSASNPLPSVSQSEHKTRVLKALPAAIRHKEGSASADPAQRITPEIPSSQFARIRAWVKYGMTAAQAAAVYGVAINVIERILRQI